MEVALLSMSYLDTALRYALQSKFTLDDRGVLNAAFDRNGAPLGTLSGKVTVAVALGLLHPDIASEIDALRRIRNHFAHGIHAASWSDSVVVREAGGLNLDEEKVVRLSMLDGGSAEHQNLPSRISNGYGGFIEPGVHNILRDANGYVGFYCPAEPSVAMEDENQRKYLTSFWLVMIAVAQSFVFPWSAALANTSGVTPRP